MLAVCTTNLLSYLDSITLKRAPVCVPPTCALDVEPTCIVWAPDNSALFISSKESIFKYDSSERHLKPVYLSSHPSSINALASKDRGSTLIFSQGQQVLILETHSGRIVQKFDSHKAPVTSIALSNDGSLLATTSAAAVHIHNLSHGSHTVLRGLTSISGSITACQFSPHSRTRLLIGAGAQLLVYDTTRPSGPIKSFTLGRERSLGEIVSVASSPFSKTLIAVACSGGTIHVVDLEKDKGILRALSVHVPLTSLVFSAEGVTLYAGTENGKVLIQDLRLLDKAPKSIIISAKGERVVAMSVQQKLKTQEAQSKPIVATSSKPLLTQDTNKHPVRHTSAATSVPGADEKAQVAENAPPPIAERTASRGGTPGKLRALAESSPRPARTMRAGITSPLSKGVSSGGITKRVISPPKTPLHRRSTRAILEEADVSVHIENLLAPLPGRRAKENVVPMDIDPKPVPSDSTSVPPPAVSRTSSGQSSRTSDMVRSRPASAGTLVTTSTTSRKRSESTSTSGTSVSAARRTAKSSTESTGPRAHPPVPSVHVEPAAISSKSRTLQSQTPSLELPDMHARLPVTPRKRRGKERMAVLGLGSPELDRWFRAGDEEIEEDAREQGADSRRVGFTSKSSKDNEARDEQIDDNDKLEVPRGAVPTFTVEVSPRRPLQGNVSTWPSVTSPLRNLSPHPASPGSHAAANLLQGMLRDAMYDFRQETRSQLTGLHLDMLKMGRGIRTELRTIVDEFRGELSTLQEENRQLRTENERLRRGY
ncbi:WD40 repeat-like protein [Laetiporus sulphureus 93-53]|uniref:WD40 repeat-like protein n=1 Tax=Laetiporus sulphureus 93-53 TaxID=1314785 RepID=A0A165C757_9APHY|nr:WD40 repeat-like protein [Laetiporus sulphureus 93-53]KZT02316.1 WD40 repeat-like protein [Laetiporus sulphureus 93-53]